MDKGSVNFVGPESASVILLHQALEKRFPTTQFKWLPSTVKREYSFSIGFDNHSAEEVVHAMNAICMGKEVVHLTILEGLLCFDC